MPAAADFTRCNRVHPSHGFCRAACDMFQCVVARADPCVTSQVLLHPSCLLDGCNAATRAAIRAVLTYVRGTAVLDLLSRTNGCRHQTAGTVDTSAPRPTNDVPNLLGNRTSFNWKKSSASWLKNLPTPAVLAHLELIITGGLAAVSDAQTLESYVCRIAVAWRSRSCSCHGL
jgi:hypothetical protein